MAWPKGKKRNVVIDTVTTGSDQVGVLHQQPKGYDVVLGIRKIVDGPFHGLWQLERIHVKNNDVKVLKVLDTGNLKRYIVSKVALELTKTI